MHALWRSGHLTPGRRMGRAMPLRPRRAAGLDPEAYALPLFEAGHVRKPRHDTRRRPIRHVAKRVPVVYAPSLEICAEGLQ